MGSALDSALRICRPAESFGALYSHADELWQNAHILLLHGEGVFSVRGNSQPRRGYLAGNKPLREATERGDELEVQRQLLRSLHGAVKQSYRRLRRRLAHEKLRRLALDEVAEERLGVYQHASELEPWELTLDARRELILGLLREAAAISEFSRETLELAVRILGGQDRAFEVARELNVSKAAISQRLKPVRTWLRRQHPSLEVPFA